MEVEAAAEAPDEAEVTIEAAGTELTDELAFYVATAREDTEEEAGEDERPYAAAELDELAPKNSPAETLDTRLLEDELTTVAKLVDLEDVFVVAEVTRSAELSRAAEVKLARADTTDPL